ncbi:DUF3983 domain-containing protein [Bacillus thuringiensis serovar yunnanensis]|nr:DUF3983 domain-containing protein [Bacillus thuringiensis serovar yunnanensis]
MHTFWGENKGGKRKTKKAIARRGKLFEKHRVETAWKNLFVQAGILK